MLASSEWWSHLHCRYVSTLHWRHDERHGVSNRRRLDCLLNRLFRCRKIIQENSGPFAIVRGMHQTPVDSPHKGPVTRIFFHAFSLLSHTYSVQTELIWLLANEFNTKKLLWLLANEFNTKKLLVVTYFSNLFYCVAESWWNMPFVGTLHGNGVADAVAKLLRLWQHTSALWRHAVWIRIVTSHNAWMGYEYSLRKPE